MLSDETLPELSAEEDVADFVLVEIEEIIEAECEEDAGFGSIRRAPLMTGAFNA